MCQWWTMTDRESGRHKGKGIGELREHNNKGSNEEVTKDDNSSSNDDVVFAEITHGNLNNKGDSNSNSNGNDKV